jgi:hypothetical protein
MANESAPQGSITELRLRLLNAGYAPVPLNGKAPVLDEWQLVELTPAEVRSWPERFQFAKGSGARTQYMPTIDADILVAEAAAAVEALVRERFEERGHILVRVGLAPKRAIPFRTDTPFEKIKVPLIAPDGKEGQKIELLCDGQQLACFGIHPDTHKPYAWSGGDLRTIARESLPDISAAEAQQLVDDAVALLVHDFGYQRAPERPPRGSADTGSAADWGYLLENIRVGRDWHDSLLALSGKLVTSGAHGGAVTNLLRAAMNNSSQPHDARWQERYDDIPRLVGGAEKLYADNSAGFRGQLEQGKASKQTLLQSSAEFVAGYVPPDYLIDGLLQRRYVYSMTAPTGSGKTALALLFAAHIALGKELGGREVEKGKVLYFAGENPDDVRSRWIKQRQSALRIDQEGHRGS